MMGEQFSKLQISEALNCNQGDVDEAIEYLLREQCKYKYFFISIDNLSLKLLEKKPTQLFTEDIIAVDTKHLLTEAPTFLNPEQHSDTSFTLMLTS